jgi:hypothetical protein
VNGAVIGDFMSHKTATSQTGSRRVCSEHPADNVGQFAFPFMDKPNTHMSRLYGAKTGGPEDKYAQTSVMLMVMSTNKNKIHPSGIEPEPSAWKAEILAIGPWMLLYVVNFCLIYIL